MTTIIGGVILPALVSLNINTNFKTNNRDIIIWSTFGFSQKVGISAAIEEFFHFSLWRTLATLSRIKSYCCYC
ncbi:DUF4231 domain-containing protein [Nostoc sp.]|uniref:DUF4231 domain-containing protein n=1 Tax=Nostoc sp. TaxID=1180 RepID=UPI002FFB1396